MIRLKLGRGFIVLLALALDLSLAASAQAALSYTLSSELKKDGCSGDTDSDCLDNLEEGNLAWITAPWYFYDEDEDCSGWTNKYGLPSLHFDRQDFFQVRPLGADIDGWTPTDGRQKWIRLVYFLAYPHDCGGLPGAGHQGDSEHIKVDLYSYDLKTWYLNGAYYAHHTWGGDYFTGAYLEDRARALGTSWISIAADEDSKGSWPGLRADSSDCAGSEDGPCYGFCDCFIGTWQSDFNNGFVEVVDASRNVGGPGRESWNSSVVTVSGTDAYSELDVGHGLIREYWTKPANQPQSQKFCGWECPVANRKSDGTCSLTIHDKSDCSSSLQEKLDYTSFSMGSCSGVCGGSNQGCYCDAACVSFGDCCADACSLCGAC